MGDGEGVKNILDARKLRLWDFQRSFALCVEMVEQDWCQNFQCCLERWCLIACISCLFVF